MKAAIDWTIHMVTNDEKAARAVLARVEKELDVPLEIQKVQRYWKYEREHEAFARSSLSSEIATEATCAYAFLRLLGKLTTSWTISPPIEIPTEVTIDAIGGKSSFCVSGVTFVHATLKIERPA